MKKRLAAGGVALALLAVLGIGTAAYFVTGGKTVNEITLGTVKLAFADKDGNIYAAGEPGSSVVVFDGVMPGTSKAVDPQTAYVKNIGDQPFYLRVRADVDVTLADGTQVSQEEAEQLIRPDFDPNASQSTPWRAKVDEESGETWWYYAADLVEAGELVCPFETVSFDPTMGNEYQNAHVTVTVTAQAVQAKNNPVPLDGSILDVKGWPAADEAPAPSPSEAPAPTQGQ